MERGDAFLDGRMRAKEFLQKLPSLMRAEGIGNKEVCGSGGSSLHWGIVGAHFLKSRGEAVGVTREKRSRRIGEEFASARDGKLDKLCGDGCENNRDDKADEHQRILIVSTTSPKHRHAESNIGEYRDNADQNDGYRHNQNVSVAHV